MKNPNPHVYIIPKSGGPKNLSTKFRRNMWIERIVLYVHKYLCLWPIQTQYNLGDVLWYCQVSEGTIDYIISDTIMSKDCHNYIKQLIWSNSDDEVQHS